MTDRAKFDSLCDSLVAIYDWQDFANFKNSDIEVKHDLVSKLENYHALCLGETIKVIGCEVDYSTNGVVEISEHVNNRIKELNIDPLYYPATRGENKMVQFLLNDVAVDVDYWYKNKCYNPGFGGPQSTFCRAIYLGHSEVVEAMVKANAKAPFVLQSGYYLMDNGDYIKEFSKGVDQENVIYRPVETVTAFMALNKAKESSMDLASDEKCGTIEKILRSSAHRDKDEIGLSNFPSQQGLLLNSKISLTAQSLTCIGGVLFSGGALLGNILPKEFFAVVLAASMATLFLQQSFTAKEVERGADQSAGTLLR